MDNFCCKQLNSRETRFENKDIVFIIEPFDSSYMRQSRMMFDQKNLNDDVNEREYTPTLQAESGEFAISSVVIKNKSLQELHIPSMLGSFFIACVQFLSTETNDTVQHVSIGEGIRYLETACDCNLKSLKSVLLPSTLEYMGACCFEMSDTLKEATLPNRITYIEGSCFDYCADLKIVNLPKSLKAIAHSSFSNCPTLRSITIPPRTEFIGRGVFQKNSSLRTVFLPKSINFIGDAAFSDCHPDLTFFVYPGSYAHMWAVSHGYHVASAEL